VSRVDDGGPNHHVWYVTSINDVATFDWTMHPDIEDFNSEFAQRQYGDWVGPDVACYSTPLGQGGNGRMISAVNYRDGVARHEAGPQYSHWANYAAAVADPRNNLGAGAEGFTKVTNMSRQDFATDLLDEIRQRSDAILQATAAHDPPCSQVCTPDCLRFNGFVNRPPYVP
jgi:hypothetical protein